ncbi:MAG: putative sulfate exporter family transporter [Bacteroidota bacterium]
MKQFLDNNKSIRVVILVTALVISATPFVNPPIALLLGFLFAQFIGHPFIHLNHKATNILLKTSVVGLGFGMNLSAAIHAGHDGFLLTVASIFTTLTLGYLIGRSLKIAQKTSHLVASGTAICGGSAIAAVGPMVDASEKDMSVALGTVFLLNSIALLIFPPIGHFFKLTQHQFGLWSAIAIHDTSSVVGAASTYGQEALQTATTVKLARALWIIPVALLTALAFKSKNRKIKLPWFIGLFILAMLFNTYMPVFGSSFKFISDISKTGLTVTLFLIGADLSFEKIKSVGWKPLALGVALWIFISVVSLVTIRAI